MEAWRIKSQFSNLNLQSKQSKHGVKCHALCYQIYASCDILKLYNLVRKHSRIILNLYLFTKLN